LAGGWIAFDRLFPHLKYVTMDSVLGIMPQTLLGAVLGALAGLVPVFFIYQFGPHRIPKDLETFGDLAHAAARLNVGRLAKRFGGLRARDVWSSLIAIIDPFAHPKIQINAQTRFFPEKLDPPEWLSSR
jgi:hypothetical protein